jgi:hypothetical protein
MMKLRSASDGSCTSASLISSSVENWEIAFFNRM